LVATRAEAHSVISTNGPFIGGVKHFFISLDDVLVTLALGIVASQNAAKAANKVFWALPCAWLLAGLVGVWSNQSVPYGDILSAGSLLVVGVLAAMSPSLSPRWVFLLTLLVGALHGYLNGAAMHPATFGAGFWQMLGISGSALFVGIYPATLSDLFKQQWARIVARVLGSWIAAAGLLLIGWTLRLKK
jgi:hydrogenase/urease accessory protein HupE